MRAPCALALSLVALGCGGSSSPPPERPSPTASASPRAPAAGMDETLRAGLQETLDTVREDQGIPGASAAVLMPSGEIWTGTSGAGVNERTLFAAGSITKTLVAALTLKLAEDGVLDLDDRLARWVPEFPQADAITLRQLLNHTAGTANFTDAQEFVAAVEDDPGATWTPARTLRYAQEPNSKPGEQWSYSNTNYILMGLVIERATLSKVARELHRRLLPRREFPRIVLQGDERPTGSAAVGHQNLDADPELEDTPNNGYVPSRSEATAAWTAGGLLASAEDLARAADGFLRGSLLSDTSRREMTDFVATGVGGPGEYGLGLSQMELGGQQVWTHSGDISGFHADLAYLPGPQVTVAALNNFQQQAPGQEVLIDRLVAEVGDHLASTR
jgi:D-alanyl-D-alanine carboxypeptidase